MNDPITEAIDRIMGEPAKRFPAGGWQHKMALRARDEIERAFEDGQAQTRALISLSARPPEPEPCYYCCGCERLLCPHYKLRRARCMASRNALTSSVITPDPTGCPRCEDPKAHTPHRHAEPTTAQRAKALANRGNDPSAMSWRDVTAWAMDVRDFLRDLSRETT